MRFRVIAHALVATAMAKILPRATDSADMECLNDILELAQNVPLPPPELAEITGSPTCLSPSLISVAARYKSEATSWFSEMVADISNCPAYPSKAPAMPLLPSVPTCTGETATAAATGMTMATGQRTGTTQVTGTSSPSDSAASRANRTPSTSMNAAYHETGTAFVAAVAVVAAAVVL